MTNQQTPEQEDFISLLRWGIPLPEELLPFAPES